MLTLRYNWETNQPKALDSTVEVDKIKGDWSPRQWHNFFWKYLYGHITDTLPRDTSKLSGRGGGGGCDICWLQKHFDKAPSRFTKTWYPNKSAFTKQSLGSKVEKSIFLLINWLLLQNFWSYKQTSTLFGKYCLMCDTNTVMQLRNVATKGAGLGMNVWNRWEWWMFGIGES